MASNNNSTNSNSSISVGTRQMEQVYYAKLINFERHIHKQHQQSVRGYSMASPEDTNIEIIVEKDPSHTQHQSWVFIKTLYFELF